MNAALQIESLHKSFGRTGIIRGVDLVVNSGERHAIIGPNGAGKSTLFNLITGHTVPASGSIRLYGKELVGKSPFEINRMGLSRSFQITNIFPGMSVFENIRCALLWPLGYRYSFWHLVPRASALEDEVNRILGQINLSERGRFPAGALSYAEQRALEIGISIAGRAETIMLDEPTAGMNRSESKYVVELIRKVTEGRTLLMVEHDMSVVFDLADRISVLVYGVIIATGTLDQIRDNREVQNAYLGLTEAIGA